MAQENRWEVVSGEGGRESGAGSRGSAEHLRWLAEMLDSHFNVLGVKVGWDAILGMIPGIGDLATNLAGFYIMALAANLGATPSVILRMGLNLIIDNLLDAVPILGSFFDIFWRANLKNVALLERYLEDPQRTVSNSRGVVLFAIAGVLLVSLACIGLAIYLAALLFQWLFGAGGIASQYSI